MPPQMPQAMFTPAPPNDGKAIGSLVLGILSLVGCFGALAGIPAVILGVMSRRDIRRSGGTIGGDGLALAGIITGVLSSVLSIALVIFYVAIFAAVASSSSSYTPPPYTPPYTGYPTATIAPTVIAPPPTPTALKPMPYTGLVKVVDLHASAGTLRTQLALEVGAAKDDSNKVLVITASRSCKACDEVFSTFSNYKVQSSLYDVRVVRVDVDSFPTELAALGLDRVGEPWFFKMNDKLAITDAISADEWDDNDAYSIAPVLKSFMAGTYKKRATSDGGVAKKPVDLSDPF
jgi:hypothetical protein